MFNSTLITVFRGQYKSEVSSFPVVPTQNFASKVWNTNAEESVKKKRMNECLVKYISNKNKIKILKNNIKRIYLNYNPNNQDLEYISIHYIILKK
jgi:hypothetical protein